MKLTDGLLIAFIVLKLIGEIDWNWIWVLDPFWVSIILATIIKNYKEPEKTIKKSFKEKLAEKLQERSNND